MKDRYMKDLIALEQYSMKELFRIRSSYMYLIDMGLEPVDHGVYKDVIIEIEERTKDKIVMWGNE